MAHLLPAMKRSGKGEIINISSMARYLGLFGYTGYCASKYAVIGFSEALRQEVKPFGIHVSVVCPPNTFTPGLVAENKIKPKELLELEEKVAPAHPEAIAAAILAQLPRSPFFIHPTFEERMVHVASRWMPSAAHYVTRRQPNDIE